MRECYLDDVTCIAFDFCGTLAELRPTSEEILGEWLRSTDTPTVGIANLSAALRHAGTEFPYSSLAVKNEQERRQYFVRFNARVLAFLGSDESCGEALHDYFRSRERHWKLRPEAEATLKELGRRRYRIVLASNFDPTLEQILARDGTIDLFDVVFVSGKLGIEKPDLKFYNHVRDELGLPVGRIAMVGDDFGLDVLPALSIGMKAIHFRPDAEGLVGARPLPGGRYMEISSLDDLLLTCPAASGCTPTKTPGD